ncbi:hypothetical protein [Mucilaginibacter sp.]
MKKIAVFLLLIAAASTQLKAQQLLPAQPNLELNNGLQNAFKPVTPLTPQQLLLQPKVNVDQSNKGITIYSTMPVAKVSSTDRMPVSVPNSLMNYTMLIKKVTIINPNEPVAKSLIP